MQDNQCNEPAMLRYEFVRCSPNITESCRRDGVACQLLVERRTDSFLNRG